MKLWTSVDSSYACRSFKDYVYSYAGVEVSPREMPFIEQPACPAHLKADVGSYNILFEDVLASQAVEIIRRFHGGFLDESVVCSRCDIVKLVHRRSLRHDAGADVRMIDATDPGEPLTIDMLAPSPSKKSAPSEGLLARLAGPRAVANEDESSASQKDWLAEELAALIEASEAAGEANFYKRYFAKQIVGGGGDRGGGGSGPSSGNRGSGNGGPRPSDGGSDDEGSDSVAQSDEQDENEDEESHDQIPCQHDDGEEESVPAARARLGVSENGHSVQRITGELLGSIRVLPHWSVPYFHVKCSRHAGCSYHARGTASAFRKVYIAALEWLAMHDPTAVEHVAAISAAKAAV